MDKKQLYLINKKHEHKSLYPKDTAFIYYIKYNNLPIYIGSTLNIIDREIKHNIHLNKVKIGIIVYIYFYEKKMLLK